MLDAEEERMPPCGGEAHADAEELKATITLDDFFREYQSKEADIKFYERLIAEVDGVESIGPIDLKKNGLEYKISTKEILDFITPYLKLTKGVIAGGFAMHLIDPSYVYGDVDIYVHESAPDHDHPKQSVYYPRVDNGIKEVRSFNLTIEYKHCSFQIIKCKEDPFHVIDNFDIDICKLFWNPETGLEGNLPERIHDFKTKISKYNFRPFNEFLGNDCKFYLTLNACERMIKYMKRGFALCVDGPSKHISTDSMIMIDDIQRWYLRSYKFDTKRAEFYESFKDDTLQYLRAFAIRKLKFYDLLYPNSDVVSKTFKLFTYSNVFHVCHMDDRAIGSNMESNDHLSVNGLKTSRLTYLPESSYQVKRGTKAKPYSMPPPSTVTHPFMSRYQYELVSPSGKFGCGIYQSSRTMVDVTDHIEILKQAVKVPGIFVNQRPDTSLYRRPTVFEDLSSRETLASLHTVISGFTNTRLYLAGGAMLYMVGAVDEFPRDLDYYAMDSANVVMIKKKFKLGPYDDCEFKYLQKYSKYFIENRHIHQVNRYALTINGVRTKLEIQIIEMKRYYSKLRRTPADLGFDIDVCGLNWKVNEKFEHAVDRQLELIDKACSKKAEFRPESWNVFLRRDEYAGISDGLMLTPKKILRAIKYMNKGFELTWRGKILTRESIKEYMPISVDEPEERAAEYAKRIAPK